MIKSRFAIVTHILTLLVDHPDQYISSSYIAGSININPVLVRKELAELKKHRLIQSREGKNGGIRLQKPANKIKMSDVFKLVKGDSNILGFSKNTPNPNCPIGRNINQNLKSLYQELDLEVENKLSKITLAEFQNRF